MVLRIAILCIALARVCFAQGGGSASYCDLPFLSQPAPGLYLWWAFEDQATNVTVTSWPDRIQGSLLTSSTAPLNTSTGVLFSGSTLLNGTKTSSSGFPSGPFVTWIVMQVDYWQNSWGIFQDVPVSVSQFLTPTAGGVHWSSPGPGIESGVIYTNTIMDMMVGNNGVSPVAYTNGVLDAAAVNGGMDLNFTKILAQPGYTFEILEMRWYTNMYVTQSMATLHTAYRRRQYGGQ